MCGITGFKITTQSVSHQNLTGWLKNATRALQNRGPDDSGIWSDPQFGIGLGHRRLSIIDVSSLGHQPMISHNGRFVMSYNGEIYNFKELRDELEENSISFKGQSDTEVLLEGIVHWGFKETLQRTNGMFAIALWDKSQKVLHLARDRFGQKPLYYGWAGNLFVFGSTLSALREFPDYQTEIDRNAIGLLLRHSNIPTPHTIYRNSWKLPPGTLLRLDTKAINERNIPQPIEYWSAEHIAHAASSLPNSVSPKEAVESLDSLLKTSVKNCMVADVPLGAFLSGGIDSSLVVSMMQTQSSSPIKTFSIGFTDTQYDEAKYAFEVASHLRTDHTDLYITPQDALDIIPSLPDIYDEPFADSSQIPTYLVSKLAREQVSVCLSGDGGDELFGGYNRYAWSNNLQFVVKSLPTSIRSWGGRRLRELPAYHSDHLYSKLLHYFPNRTKLTQFSDKLFKLGEIIDADNKEEMYWRLISQWKQPADVLNGLQEYSTRASSPTSWPTADSFAQQMMILDTIQYLPDDILVKLDRASMWVGLETRVPLLDHNVFEFAWSLPETLKIRKGTGKWVLRKLLERYIPQSLFRRPKMGFGVPVGQWLRGNLREWADDMLSSTRLTNDGYFKTEIVHKVWKEHLAGTTNHQHMLWPLLMFQAWLARHQ